MATKWTPMQERAIDVRDKTLLVSAAAGSGKTATLTERIIRSLTDEKNPVNIEEMLVVTYTTLAAGELSERIGRKLRERLKAAPEDENLKRQLNMLPTAKICTIDSYCAEIVRANAERLGISPSFRIPDGAECALIAESILDGVFAEIYEGELPEVASPEELSELSECLTDTGRQGELAAVIAKLYDSTKSALDGVETFVSLIEEYNPEKFTRVENTRFGRYIMTRLRDMASHYEKILRDALLEVPSGMSDKLDKVVDMLKEDHKLCVSLLGAESYAEARDILRSHTFGKAAGNTDKTLPPTTQIHGSLRDDATRLSDKFFVHTEADWKISYEGLYRTLGVLIRIMRLFDRLFREEKLRRGIAEFSDIERYAYECLWQDGELTDIARAEARRFKQVYIDEYQDVNNIQDKIFEAVSQPTNRFMVGDIKQSIYRFRSANADIFAEMKRTYPDIDSAGDSDRATIFMSDNFRCDRGIIDFVNLIFDRAFGLIGDSIGYVSEDRLNCSKTYDDYPEPPVRKPELCVLDSSALKSKYKGVEGYNDKMISPIATAEKIRELLDNGRKNDGTPILPGDIAIIMRTAKGKSNLYKDALDSLGIPASVSEEVSFFLTPEALLTLCLINSIDNPKRDIYLAGLMLSPLYSFTADELARIRRTKADTLYDSLRGYIEEHPEYRKGKEFLSSLERYRLLAEGSPADALLLRLYNETGLLALAARDGTEDRLFQLYDYARSFESSSFKGLYSFISYINSIIDRKNNLNKKESPKDKDSVAILTAHGSKGLEYPVVFYVGSESGFGGSDGGTAPRFEYQEGFGIGMYLRSPSGLSLVRNATKNVIKDYSDRRELEEELRILYVILTRARERLYIVATAGKKWDAFEKETEYAKVYLDSYSIYNQPSALRVILATEGVALTDISDFLSEIPPEISLSADLSTVVDKLTDKKPKEHDTPPEFDFIAPTSERAGEIVVPDKYREGELYKLITERFNFRHPLAHLTTLPEKLSVSKLYPELLDGTEGEALELDHADRMRRDSVNLKLPGLGILPEFISGKDTESSLKRGIATHLLFQFCDLERLYSEGGASELERLVAEGYISPEDKVRVRLDEVEMFRRSELLSRMRSAKSIFREFRFNVLLDAESFTETNKELYRGEKILVQGVIDCLYEDELGELHLVDYKTDRLTRAELKDRALAELKMRESHSTQLSYYAEAVRRIFGKYPKTKKVYSLHLGDTLDV